MNTKPSRDLYAEITNTIIAAMEKGCPPWVKPWKTLRQAGDPLIPINFSSGHSYRGINIPLLWIAGDPYGSSRWITYRQAQDMGGQVRRGEKGTPIVFWKLLTNEPVFGDSEKSLRQFPLLRCYTVFNTAQCDGLPELPPAPAPTWNPLDKADQVIHDTGAIIKHGGDKAAYISALDIVTLPLPAAFAEPSAYYSTALHELGHWTGHHSRLSRDFSGGFGSQAYANEELVAELCSAFLCGFIGIEGSLQHPSYLDMWLRVLKSDKKAIVVASARAQRAADFILKSSAPLDDSAADDNA